jgi:hypothetical protein
LAEETGGSDRAEFRMNVISEETWMKAARRGFRNPKAAKPTPMLSTTSVPTEFCMIVRRRRRAIESFDKLRKIIANENDVCAFARDVRAGTHRYSYSGLHESWGVIDSVTYHNDVVLRFGESANEFQLVLR